MTQILFSPTPGYDDPLFRFNWWRGLLNGNISFYKTVYDILINFEHTWGFAQINLMNYGKSLDDVKNSSDTVEIWVLL